MTMTMPKAEAEPGGAGGRVSAWQGVARAVAAGDASLAADEVLRLDAAGRREVARRLPGHIGPARNTAQLPLAFGEADRPVAGSWVAAMRVAGAGTMGGPAAVAAWIFRRDFTSRGEEERLPVGALLRVVAARPAEWQADLAVRVAGRLRGTRRQLADGTVALALELLRRAGGPPPSHEPIVAAWVSTPPDLDQDPLAPHLIPRLFEAEGAGRVLRDDRLDHDERLDHDGRLGRDGRLRRDGRLGRDGRFGGDGGGRGRGSWLGALRDLADAGRVERESLIDGCVRRFLRGGSAVDLRFFVRLHDLLDPAPTPDRVRDYLRLLPTAPGPVAELSLRQLRPRDGAATTPGGTHAKVTLSGEEVSEAVTALLFRPEGKLVRAGLTLLDQSARDTEGPLDELAPALASAFLCESYEVKERAVRVAVKHAARFTPAGAEAVREAAGILPPELAAHLTGPYGTAAGGSEPSGFQPVALPAFEPPARLPFPAPIANLAETFDRLYHEFSFERWLDGFVRDPSARRPPVRTTDLYDLDEWSSLSQWTEALLREATGTGLRAPRRWQPDLQLAGWRLPEHHGGRPPLWTMLLRCAEILNALRRGTLPPYLLATPTLTSGHIDPAELVARIEGYERAGVHHLPADLEQALLRLPREVHPDVLARAGRLARTSETGAVLERWLRRRPEPETCVEWPRDATSRSLPRGRVRLAEPTGMPLVDALLSDPPPPSVLGAAPTCDPNLWRLMLPSDREVVATRLLSQVFTTWGSPGHVHGFVTPLCHQDGPVGEGTALVLGMLLAERGWHAEGCQELLLRAADTGYLPAEECGRQLGRCLRGGAAGWKEVAAGLEEAARKGAHREVWEIMRGLLPVFLPGGDERARGSHTRALEFAVNACRWAGARGPIPEVAAIAARKGSSGLVREARRLHERLSDGGIADDQADG
ncbi:DUF6493 family protein [Nonomuraea monospora]